MNKLLLLIPVAMLPGCAAPLLVATGLSATSLAVNETTGRTVSDHVVSTVKGKDCRIVRSLNGNDMCQEEVKLQVTESQYRPSRIADIESRYR